MHFDNFLPLAALLTFSFGANLPLGYLRETSRKFSLHWFILVHLSIPFIVALRSMFGFDWQVIPLTLFCAVAGQFAGARFRRRTLQ